MGPAAVESFVNFTNPRIRHAFFTMDTFGL
jgi:hypothetical protein